jgi:hypothetical protein
VAKGGGGESLNARDYETSGANLLGTVVPAPP